MVYYHVKCFKEWILIVNGMLLRKRNFAFVAWVMIIIQKIAKEEENLKCKIATRSITLLRFQKKDDPTKRSGDGASAQDAPRSNQIIQGDWPGDQTLSTVSSNDS